MANIKLDSNHQRLSWVAIVLSLAMPGVGHIYCGKLIAGLILLLLYSMSVPVIMITLAHYSPVSTGLFVVLLASLFGILIFSLADVWRITRRTRANYVLKDYNRFTAYLLLVLIGMTSCLGCALFVREQYVEAFIVPADSMFPTIVDGDRILANKIAYQNHPPRHGDIVVFTPGDQPGPQIKNIKRIVALAGDSVEIKENELYVNGRKLKREVISRDMFREDNGAMSYEVNLGGDQEGSPCNFERIVVPEYHCFVLGDNRNCSHDSRDYGPIPLASIIARADYVYCPAGDWSRFGKF